MEKIYHQLNKNQIIKEIISILYIACELKGIEINDILRDIILEVNKDGYVMLNEIKQKMVF